MREYKYVNRDTRLLLNAVFLLQATVFSCRSVEAAVEDGLLPRIPGYQYLDRISSGE